MEEKIENLKETGIVTVGDEGNRIECISIIGQIEGHQVLPDSTKSTKYEHIIPILTTIEEDKKIHGVLFLINTVGGDVEAGLAIAELIAGMKKPTASIVLGGGHSIGVPLAVSAKRSFIVKSATMTVHPVRVNGLVIGTEKTFESFIKIQDRIENFITEHSKISKSQLRLLMKGTEMTTDVGTILDGEDAVKYGLCDEVGTLSEALKCLHDMIDANKE